MLRSKLMARISRVAVEIESRSAHCEESTGISRIDKCESSTNMTIASHQAVPAAADPRSASVGMCKNDCDNRSRHIEDARAYREVFLTKFQSGVLGVAERRMLFQ